MNEMKYMENMKSASTDLTQHTPHHIPGGHCKNNNNNNLPGVTMEIANKNYSKAMTSLPVSSTSGGSGEHVMVTGGLSSSAPNKQAGVVCNGGVTSNGDPGNSINPAVTSCVQECASCGQKIWDRFLLHAMDRYWHTECLKCSCCQAPLGDIGGSCYAKGGMVLCKNDYLRLFGKTGTCTGCGQGIPANEFVMKVQGHHFYHLNCFACVVCQHRLVSGDRYCVVNGNLLCELDYPKVVKGSIQLPPRITGRVGV